ncbi:diacylglycerol O-acyltransferase 1 [Nematocida major]|uniref:diacylglycerol O-acyltransferase 1 n=1 Tax=Nematocida major TaxID=1912982 RepID=UPI0020085580|nr:diacylglycerol O-acyltransferase 1 [Nematocida major]KAH9387175.1 diacylglycerol O-acyltransferase 1 [Nematocida major]
MNRVHSKCAHHKHSKILDRVEVGKGGWAWIMVALVLINYQVHFSSRPQRVIALMHSDIQDSISPAAILSFLGVNIFRWGILYGVSEHLEALVIYSVILACISLETVVALFTAKGFVGLGLRYLSICQLMKGISYILSTRESAILGPDDRIIDKPNEAVSVWRFIALPTLCYQSAYPMSPSISVYSVVMYALMIRPLAVLSYYCLKVRCRNAAISFWEDLTVDKYVSVFMWCNLGWVSVFSLVFIAAYGLQSELTRFGDRNFFGAWWNASVSGYWRNWNSLVYKWIRRHVHKNLIKRNITIRSSKLVIFIVSGAVHEYIIGDLLKCRGLGFFAMASQVPLDAFIRFGHRWAHFNQEIAATVAFNLIGAPGLVLISVMPAKFFEMGLKSQ